MEIVEEREIEQLAAELYEANRDTFIADISSRIVARYESAVTQLRNGETMDFETFKRKANDISF